MSGIFNFLKKTKKENSTPSQIRADIQKVEKGLRIRLYRDRKEQVEKLPLKLSILEIKQQEQIDLLEVIEALWYDEYLEEAGESYVLPYQRFRELPSEVKSLLGIPDPAKVQCKLGHEGAVGSSRFQFVLEKNTGKWRNIERTSKQTGPWITLPDQTVLLLDEEQYLFEQMLKKSPDPKDKDHIFTYVAQIRTKAREMQIPMDDYLEEQEYLFIDKLDVQVDYDQTVITLKPSYQTAHDVPQEVLDKMGETLSVYATGPNHQKIFVAPEIHEQAKTIDQIPLIQGADIPRFAENPEAFLPEIEGLDLSFFSERVKSLGIKVYRAQPYVYAKERERGWFHVDVGFSAVDEAGESQGTFAANEIVKLIQTAKENGEDYIEWNGQWLKIPGDAEEFSKATEQLQTNVDLTQPVDINKLPYILEIYENINQLEFNQPILAARQEMQDLGVLDPNPPQSFWQH
ncbi:hypothetical protein [Brevibacillus sp. H7]|uniref:hypothetical protein n=1 Tax=Brevibacillus sp. H7 TaxID=3349138 RepID=UPI00383A9A35